VTTISLYEESSEKQAVEKFVIQYRPLVKKVSLYLKRRLPSTVELNDILQSGLVGLLEARKGFKPGTGASFETYASIRIRGAIIDSLRKNSWVSRETIRNMRKMSQAISKIEQRDQAQASSEQIIAELGISMDDFFKMSQEINVCNVMSLDELDHDYFIPSEEESNPEVLTQREHMKEWLKDVLHNLSEKEQQLLSLYYVEEFTFKQIGEIFDLTEARICQLHAKLIARIHSKIKK
jgi:RNA polymerase sigma factor for flagellar operon FliA